MIMQWIDLTWNGSKSSWKASEFHLGAIYMLWRVWCHCQLFDWKKRNNAISYKIFGFGVEYQQSLMYYPTNPHSGCRLLFIIMQIKAFLKEMQAPCLWCWGFWSFVWMTCPHDLVTWPYRTASIFVPACLPYNGLLCWGQMHFQQSFCIPNIFP